MYPHLLETQYIYRTLYKYHPYMVDPFKFLSCIHFEEGFSSSTYPLWTSLNFTVLCRQCGILLTISWWVDGGHVGKVIYIWLHQATCEKKCPLDISVLPREIDSLSSLNIKPSFLQIYSLVIRTSAPFSSSYAPITDKGCR